jgi:hypothetical protein
MPRLKYAFALIISFSMLFSACEEIIEIDFNPSDSQIVIEGDIGNIGEPNKVIITKSVAINDSIFPNVENALVVIYDDFGNRDTLLEVDSSGPTPGIYSGSKFSGISGRNYHLEVETQNQFLSASSYLNNQVEIDSINIVETIGSTPGPPGSQGIRRFLVRVSFQDPPNEKNYYRFVEYVNGKKSSRIYVDDDRLTNGTYTTINLRSAKKYNTGDIVTIELQCIDQAVYEYFNSFGNLNGGPQSASTPANPYTNIVGSKLGYFNAHTVSRKTVVIQ